MTFQQDDLTPFPRNCSIIICKELLCKHNRRGRDGFMCRLKIIEILHGGRCGDFDPYKKDQCEEDES